MKKIFSILMMTAFVFAFGTAYAGVLSNGITDFSGGSYDTFAIVPAAAPQVAMEGSQDGRTMYNGVTDFTGGAYDLFVVALAPAGVNTIEGAAAGGIRLNTVPAFNGVTDFSGSARDDGAIDR